MNATDWRGFWNSYRKKEIDTEEDLFVEVGKTVNGQPLSHAQFLLTIDRISALLRLQPKDKLLELCCGNGLMTRNLAPLVEAIEAVDFSAHLVAHAKERSERGNVRYVCADVLVHLHELRESQRFIPTKILLGDALAYFEPMTLRSMLRQLSSLTSGHFSFLATNVPCDELKWNFYNTPARRKRYADNSLEVENTNDGLGRWWTRDELVHAAGNLPVHARLLDQPPSLSSYRLDVLYDSLV